MNDETTKAENGVIEVIPKQLTKSDTVIFIIFTLLWNGLFVYLFLSASPDPNFSWTNPNDLLFLVFLVLIALFPEILMLTSSLYKAIFDTKKREIYFSSPLNSKTIKSSEVSEWGTKKAWMSTGRGSGQFSPVLMFKLKNGTEYKYALSVVWQSKKEFIINLCEKILGKKPLDYGSPDAKTWKKIRSVQMVILVILLIIMITFIVSALVIPASTVEFLLFIASL